MPKTIEKHKFKTGDLVKMTRHTYQNGIIYRVVSSAHGMGRLPNGHWAAMPKYKLKPVLVLINASPQTPRHHTIQPESQLAPVDLMELGKTFSELDILIKEEVKRLSGE